MLKIISMKDISIIIPSRGESKYLLMLVDQLKRNKEFLDIILIDNSLTSKLADQYESDAEVKYQYVRKSGVSIARNKGADIAQTKYLYFLDDDVLLNDKWYLALQEVTSTNLQNVIIGGPVKISKIDINMMSKKYSYIFGEKNFGDKDKILKSNYLAGCNLLISKKLFKELGCFPDKFGHKGSTIAPNEDIYLQEKARRLGYKIYYKADMKVTHHTPISNINLEKRIELQGIYDRKLDIDLNKFRLVARLIKYSCYVVYYRLYLKRKKLLNSKFDFIRRYSYINGKSPVS